MSNVDRGEKLVPDGWKRVEVERKKGATIGKIDVYIYSPDGSVFRSKKKIQEYIDEHKIPLHIDEFVFNVNKTKLSWMTSSSTELDHDQPICGEEIEETYFSEQNLSQRVLNLSESVFQLTHEKERSEMSLKHLEKEAHETVSHFQMDIKLLNEELSFLKQDIVKKDKEINELRNRKTIEANSQTENLYTCTCHVQISVLKRKINTLKTENLKLMDTIQPFDAFDNKIIKEAQDLKSKFEKLEKVHQEDVLNLEAVITHLSTDLDTLTSENNNLRIENCALMKHSKDNNSEKNNFIRTMNTTKKLKPRHAPEEIELCNSFGQLSQHTNYFDVNCSNKISTEPKNISGSKKHERLNEVGTQKVTYRNQQRQNNGFPQLLILSDSHGRNLYNNIMTVWPNCTFNVSCIFKPNAGLSGVVNDLKALTESFTKEDYVVVIGGTNDVVHEGRQLIKTFQCILDRTSHTNVIMAGLPYRHDIPGWNNKISLINLELEKLVHYKSDATFLAINDLPRHMYTHHGLHFNRSGKIKISQMIKQLLQGKSCIANQTSSNHKNSVKNVISSLKHTIEVVEANMDDIIDCFKDDSSSAFAHCISRDFDDDHHMSAGVAVRFRKRFGRPQLSDFLNMNQTRQKVKGGATVYGLVTKAKYSGKPLIEEYDQAFSCLAQDFQNEHFKTLFCSPLGCVRDEIPVEHFAQKIVEFQRNTNADIRIINYRQKMHRRLWNGLSYDGFLKKLKEEISKSEECCVKGATKEPENNNLTRLLTSTPVMVPGAQTYAEVAAGVHMPSQETFTPNKLNYTLSSLSDDNLVLQAPKGPPTTTLTVTESPITSTAFPTDLNFPLNSPEPAKTPPR